MMILCYLNFYFKIKDQLPSLKAIVQYRGKLVQEYPDVYEVKEFLIDFQ